MKLLALSLALWSFACHAEAFRKAEESCPLKLERPETEAAFLQRMEPLSFVIQEGSFPCNNFLANLTAARDTLIAFHERTLNPAPAKVKDELEVLARHLSTLLVSVMVDADTLVYEGKLCDGTPMSENLKAGLTQTVRSLYASHESVRKTAEGMEIAIKWSQDIPKMLKAFKESLNAGKALKEARFVDRTCKAMEQEYNRFCGQGGKPILETERKRVQQSIQAKLKENEKAAEAKLGDKRIRDVLAEFLRVKSNRPDLSDPFGIEDAYYQYVAPVLKMCGAIALIGGDTKNFIAKCGDFFCDGDGLFPFPDGTGPAKAKHAICGFADDYRTMERAYLNGFKASVRLPGRKTGTAPNNGKYCPPKPEVIPEAKVIRLPPVETEPEH